jgi:hypothetical protein
MKAAATLVTLSTQHPFVPMLLGAALQNEQAIFPRDFFDQRKL